MAIWEQRDLGLGQELVLGQGAASLLSRIIALNGALLAGLLAVALALRPFQPQLHAAPSFIAVTHGLIALTTACVAFLALGRHRVLRGPFSYWAGLAFGAHTICTIFYILCWPGLGAGSDSLLGVGPDVSGWAFVVTHLLVGVLLVVAAVSRRPGPEALAGWAWGCSVAAGLVLVVLGNLLLVAAGERLPAIVTDGRFTPMGGAATWMAALLLVAVAVLCSRKYHRSRDTLVAYVAIGAELLAFGDVLGISGGERYSLLWYLSRAALVGGCLVVLFGLLWDYVSLHRREQERTRELEAAVRVLAKQRDLTDSVVQHAPAGMALYDGLTQTILWHNPAYTYLLDKQWHDQDLVGRALDEIVPHSEELGVADIHRSVAGGQPFRLPEFEFAGFDRGLTYFNWSIVPVPRADGDGHDVLTMAVEVTEVVATRREAQRLAIEAQLRAEEIEAVVDSMADPVVIYDREGRVVHGNPAANRIIRRNAPARDYAEIHATRNLRRADGLRLAMEELPGARALGGETVRAEHLIVSDARGNDLHVLASASPVYVGGELYGAVVAWRDISELQRQQEELRAQERRAEQAQAEAQRRADELDLVINSIADGVMIYDREGNLVRTNAALRTMMRYTPEEMDLPLAERMAALDLRDGEGQPLARDDTPVWRALQGEAVVTGFPLVAFPGTEREVVANASAAPLRDAEGNVTGAVVTLTDITALQRARMEAQQRADELDTVIRTIPDGVVVLDRDGMPMTENDAAQKLFGWSEAEKRLRRVDRMAGRDPHTAEGRRLTALELPASLSLLGRVVSNVVFCIRCDDDDEMWLLINTAPLFASDGTVSGTIATFVDITVMHRLTTELMAANESLSAANEELAATNEELLLASEALEREHSLLESVVEALPGAFMAAVPPGLKIIYTNAYLRRFSPSYAQPGTDPTSRPHAVLYYPDGAVVPPHEWPMVRAQSDGEVTDGVEYLHRRDGELVPIRLYAAPVRDRRGSIIGSVIVFFDITAEKAAQAQREQLQARVAASEKRYRTIGELIPYGIWATDASGGITYVSPALLELTGMTFSEYAAFGWVQLLPEDEREEFVDAWTRASAAQRYWSRAYRVLGANGQYHWLIGRGVPQYDDSGAFTGYLGVNIDISELKAAQENAQRRADELDAIINSIADAVSITDDQGRLIRTNEAGVRLLRYEGFARATVAERAQRCSYFGEDGIEYAPEQLPLARSLRGEIVEAELVEMVWPDGESTWVTASAAPLRDAAGRIVGAVLTNTDVTDRRRSEEELERYRDHLEELVAARTEEVAERSRVLQSVFNNSLSSLVLLDTDFNFVAVNETYARACQRPVDDFIGHNYFVDYPSEELPATFREVIRTRRPWTATARPFEYPDHPERGVTYWDLSLVPILDSEGDVELLLFSLQDVTERTRAQQQANAQRERLRALAGELALAEQRERQRIATGLHDDISQTLAFAKMKLAALRAGGTPERQQAQIQELAGILDEVIANTRDLTYELSTPILFQKGLAEAIVWAATRAHELSGLPVEVTTTGELRRLPEDMEVTVFQAVKELLSNAGKYAEAKRVDVTVAFRPDEMRVTVSDDGVGFDPDTPELHASGGFGLLNIRERLLHLGGTFTIESAPGSGTRCTLLIPLSEAWRPGQESNADENPGTAGG